MIAWSSVLRPIARAAAACSASLPVTRWRSWVRNGSGLVSASVRKNCRVESVKRGLV